MQKTVYSSELGPMNGKYDPKQGKLWIRGPWGEAWDMDRESAKELRAFLNQIPELDPDEKQFILTRRYHGGDINIIEQAAQNYGAQLLSVDGYALKDYPGNRTYVEGDKDYVFVVVVDSSEEAVWTLDTLIRNRVRALYNATIQEES